MAETPFARPGVDVTPEETLERHRRGEAQLVDVREFYEFDAGRIPGARHIELGRLADGVQELDSDRPVILYCRIGGRSGVAARALRRAGYDAWSMEGGLEEWAAKRLPLEPEDGTVAPH